METDLVSALEKLRDNEDVPVLNGEQARRVEMFSRLAGTRAVHVREPDGSHKVSPITEDVPEPVS